MGQVIKAYVGIFFLLLVGLVGAGVIAAGAQVSAARSYHADVVGEIECSNFSPSVIEACKQQAARAGYALEVKDVVFDASLNRRMAEVILTFDYAVPVLNLVSEHEVRGFAR